MLAPSPIPNQISHTLFDIILLVVDAVLCHDQDTSMTVHTWARSKMPQYNIVNNVKLFSHDWFQGNSMCIDRRHSAQHNQMGVRQEELKMICVALQVDWLIDWLLYGTSAQKGY